jgi:cellulose synthase/poly-beta-1,6-N-acetylglucosamine synthase-like glycosyltransferase
MFSVNWAAAWISVPLAMVETYSLIDAFLFGVTMWRLRQRPAPPPAEEGLGVDVFITTYNEPVDLVMTTAVAARNITYPHKTWILDDGARPGMQQAARDAGVGYITRSPDWNDLPRHAKAGNLNNALASTDGEFLLILDADQIPEPHILHRMLGHFSNDNVALVQTPQWFSNVLDDDILGSQAPLFYGPIQQGKDGWNAAFFCGSNAIIRREALMQIGVTGYVQGVRASVELALKGADRVIARARSEHGGTGPRLTMALDEIGSAVRNARDDLKSDQPVANVTYDFQRKVQLAARNVVTTDLASMTADLDTIARISGTVSRAHIGEDAVDRLASREWSPLSAIGPVHNLVRAVDVDRYLEALPVMPLATNSVTEDMATCMRLHAAGWESVYHHEILAKGLAPEAALGPGHHAGFPAREPALPKGAQGGTAPDVLRHHVELPLRFRCGGLHRSAHHFPVLRRDAGRRVQHRLFRPADTFPDRQPDPVLRGGQRQENLARPAVQRGAVPDLDQGLHDGGRQRPVRPQPRLRCHSQNPAGRRPALVPYTAPARGHRRPPARRRRRFDQNVLRTGCARRDPGERCLGCFRPADPQRHHPGSPLQGLHRKKAVSRAHPSTAAGGRTSAPWRGC